MSAASQLLSNWQHIIEDLRLVPAGGGVFEVDVDGELIYSKKANGRHADDGEVLNLFSERFAAGLTRYGT